MATLILNCSSASNSSTFEENAQIRLTYTASNGTLKITEIEGKRSDGYHSYNASKTNISISVGGTNKSVSLNHYVDFNTSWTSFDATDISWSGLTGTSISITVTMPSADEAFGGAKFTGSATMSWSTYTITYNANGGSLGSVPSTQTKTHGTDIKVTSAKPTKTGYTFLGWSVPTRTDVDEKYHTEVYYDSNETIQYNGNQTLKAVWEENKLTVNYYSNYATSAFEDALNAVGADKNVKVYTYDFYYDNDYSTYGLANYSNSSGSVYMTRTGYTGTGKWGTSTSGGNLVDENTGYSTGQALAKALGKDLSNDSTSVNVYAQWQINTYTFKYNSNGGTGNMNSQSVTWNSDFTLSNNVFKREGYKFIGWYAYRDKDDTWFALGQTWLTENEIIANGYEKKLYDTQTEYTFNNSWIRGDENSISDYTMYAVWEISGVVYIDNGTTFEPYLAYIDNGASWDLYLAYIDDGASWNIIS